MCRDPERFRDRCHHAENPSVKQHPSGALTHSRGRAVFRGSRAYHVHRRHRVKHGGGGGAGSTTVLGGAGGGVLSGGSAGRNLIVAGQQATTIFGRSDGDVLFTAGSAGDLVVAGAGNETLS